MTPSEPYCETPADWPGVGEGTGGGGVTDAAGAGVTTGPAVGTGPSPTRSLIIARRPLSGQ